MELPPLIEAMSSPSFYPHRPERVDLVQTHISWVFLAGDLVYKVKKPVDFGFLDFTTLRRRGHYCRRELELNRRLAPGLYLEVAAVRESKGGFRIGGRGRVVEYALVMRRIPRERFLPALLEARGVSPAMMRQLAGLMARFHRGSATGAGVDGFGSLATVRRNVRENFAQTRSCAGRLLGPEDYAMVQEYAEGFMRRRRRLFERRVRERRVRDGHGDLHAEHVGWLGGRPFVFDCIEFNRRFRCADVAGEVAFLVMDLEFRGAYPLAQAFADEYLRLSGDAELPALLDFYLCYRAYVRAKINSFLADDPHGSAAVRKEAGRRARDYFSLAAAYARRDAPPLLAATTGLVGSGKSTLARLLERRLDFAVLRSDVIRKELAGLPPGKRVLEAFRSGLYSPEMTKRTYEALIRRAGKLLAAGRDVVLDATFTGQKERAMALELAGKAGARLVMVEAACEEALVRERLRKRMEEGAGPSDGRWEIYLEQRKRYRSPEAAFGTVRVDTGLGKKEVRRRLFRGLYPLAPVGWHPRGKG